MARVLKGSHSFTCTPRVHPLTEWNIPAFSVPAEAGPHWPTPVGWKAELALGGWLHTEIDVRHCELNLDMVTHFGTNRARRWLTSPARYCYAIPPSWFSGIVGKRVKCSHIMINRWWWRDNERARSVYNSLFLLQGLYEYVRPSWEERPRPAVDELDMKSFGSTTPDRPTSTDNATMKVRADGTVLPASVSLYV